jgi:hypothetical protein
MATQRTEKTTIPDGKDPLAGVSYSQPKPQPPINNLISDTTKREPGVQPPAPAPRAVRKRLVEAKAVEEQEERSRKEKITVVIPDDLLDRLRNAAWWQRQSLATLAEEGLRHVLQRLERENGGPFEPRQDDLKRGRPLGSKNFGKKAR